MSKDKGSGFLGYDGPVFHFIAKILDLIKLNFLTALCCLPIVTIGAALTAAHYASIKIRRGESYVARNFWKSFKENLKQSTVIWLIIMAWLFLTISALYFFVQNPGGLYDMMQGMMFMIILIVAFIVMWVFPVQARFVNSIRATFANSFRLSLKYFWRTLYMVMMHALPILLLIANMKFLPIVILWGISGPVHLSSGVYDKVFKEIEEFMTNQEESSIKEEEENE